MSSQPITTEEVAALVGEVVGDPAGTEIDPGEPLTATFPGLDSMAILELIVDLEGHYGIAIEDEDVTAETFDSLATLTEFLRRKRG